MTKKEHLDIFENWIRQHKALIFKVVRAYAFTPLDREDLFQEITIQVWHSVPRFRQESAVATWLYRLSLNIAIKWIRKERNHSEAKESIEDFQHILEENKIQIDERLTWLYEEISNLDEIQRSITLLLLEGFSYKEIASITGITESNVGVKINRIKKHLITKSKNYDYGI